MSAVTAGTALLTAALGCVTSAAVSPGELTRVAGLSPEVVKTVETSKGSLEVSGRTEITLRATALTLAVDTHLSALHLEGDLLRLDPSGGDLGVGVPLAGLSDSEVSYVSPWRTVGLVGGLVAVVAGAAAVAILLIPPQHPPQPLAAARAQVLPAAPGW